MVTSVVNGNDSCHFIVDKLKERECVPIPWLTKFQSFQLIWFLVTSSRSCFQIASSLWQTLKAWTYNTSMSSIPLVVKKIMDWGLSSCWFFANSTIPIFQNPSLKVKPGGALDSTKSFTEGSWEQSSILLSTEGHFAIFALVTGWKGTSLKSGHSCLPPP